jgi:hypothetical protein
MAISIASPMDVLASTCSLPGRLENSMSFMTCAMSPCCASIAILVLRNNAHQFISLSKDVEHEPILHVPCELVLHLFLWLSLRRLPQYIRSHTPHLNQIRTHLARTTFLPGWRQGRDYRFRLWYISCRLCQLLMQISELRGGICPILKKRCQFLLKAQNRNRTEMSGLWLSVFTQYLFHNRPSNSVSR